MPGSSGTGTAGDRVQGIRVYSPIARCTMTSPSPPPCFFEGVSLSMYAAVKEPRNLTEEEVIATATRVCRRPQSVCSGATLR